MLQHKEMDGVVIIRPDSALAVDNVSEFSEYIRNLIKEGQTRFVLNLESVPYLTSMGLGTMCNLHKQLSSQGGWIRFAVVNEDIREVLSMMMLNHMFGMYETVEDAISAESSG